jgi:hypothetical protein
MALWASLLVLQSVTLSPTDDVWAYPHAGDPARDALLRVWGVDGKAVPGKDDDMGSFSVSFLRFAMPAEWTKLKSAKLRLTLAPNPAFTPEMAKASPLEVRLAKREVIEKDYDFATIETALPVADAGGILAEGAPAQWTADQPILLVIDLTKSLDKLKGPIFTLALTSRIEVANNRASYRIYSREATEVDRRPALILERAED